MMHPNLIFGTKTPKKEKQKNVFSKNDDATSQRADWRPPQEHLRQRKPRKEGGGRRQDLGWGSPRRPETLRPRRATHPSPTRGGGGGGGRGPQRASEREGGEGKRRNRGPFSNPDPALPGQPRVPFQPGPAAEAARRPAEIPRAPPPPAREVLECHPGTPKAAPTPPPRAGGRGVGERVGRRARSLPGSLPPPPVPAGRVEPGASPRSADGQRAAGGGVGGRGPESEAPGFRRRLESSAAPRLCPRPRPGSARRGPPEGTRPAPPVPAPLWPRPHPAPRIRTPDSGLLHAPGKLDELRELPAPSTPPSPAVAVGPPGVACPCLPPRPPRPARPHLCPPPPQPPPPPLVCSLQLCRRRRSEPHTHRYTQPSDVTEPSARPRHCGDTRLPADAAAAAVSGRPGESEGGAGGGEAGAPASGGAALFSWCSCFSVARVGSAFGASRRCHLPPSSSQRLTSLSFSPFPSTPTPTPKFLSLTPPSIAVLSAPALRIAVSFTQSPTPETLLNGTPSLLSKLPVRSHSWRCKAGRDLYPRAGAAKRVRASKPVLGVRRTLPLCKCDPENFISVLPPRHVPTTTTTTITRHKV
ncbi:translation initiation factor IF-2-like [Pipistrellus kuhlii]|uniref:translation initiation factor IF-2-like n=1 Tax=Pipistrellus kuhlii TaxID=59472 RepID=UPI00174F718B|nr:translation initiation factor IF-2-like [Pipistrellus kuhlii]